MEASCGVDTLLCKGLNLGPTTKRTVPAIMMMLLADCRGLCKYWGLWIEELC